MKKTKKRSQPFDINEIRKQAKKSIQHGAYTNDYALDVKEACQHLNVALATEIMCVMRYRHHQIVAKGIDSKEVSAEFEEHAKEEEIHMLMIAKRINQLGGNPKFNPTATVDNSLTEFGSASTLIEMIKDDLVAERIVISVYRKMIDWFGDKDPTTRRMLEKILNDEEEHADDLADLLHANS